jgi:hypothetical protein
MTVLDAPRTTTPSGTVEPPGSTRSTNAARFVDFELHGIVGVRLLDPTPGDAVTVTHQLGLHPMRLQRTPDITIRFVPRIVSRSPIRFLGNDEAGFTDEAFLVLRSRYRAGIHVQIPMDRIGGPCEIVCESGLPAVPLLVAIVNLTALAKGVVPVHGSAFVHRGLGVLVVGWAKGGKTETLIAFMRHGARYVGDEWIYLAPDRRMFGLPERIRLWEWQLAQVADYRARLGAGERMKLRGGTLGAEALRRLAAIDPAGRSLPGQMAARLLPIVGRQLSVQVAPERLFGRDAIVAGITQVDRLVLTMSHDDDRVVAVPADASDIADRMVFSHEYERSDLLATYLRFRFAFPDLRNEILETARERQRDLLRRAVEGVKAHTLLHPYPPRLDKLFPVLDPVLR